MSACEGPQIDEVQSGARLDFASLNARFLPPCNCREPLGSWGVQSDVMDASLDSRMVLSRAGMSRSALLFLCVL
eukprot:8462902-Alexandrium_andersonii.AAC.1